MTTLKRTVYGVLCGYVLLACPTPADAALTEAYRLAAIYDRILAADFERARADLERACPPAPTEACAALRSAALWWQIALDPENRGLDGDLRNGAEKAIAAAEAWTAREPRHAEAWFYLAASYAPLVQLRLLRGERLAAAREGAKVKSALEQTLVLDPALDDAYFGIGLYHYYADVASLGAKFLRVLLFLPGGDRVLGLKEMLQARERGVLLGGEADYQLHFVYLWYERQPERALELLRGLDSRYPSNPIFLERIASIDHGTTRAHRDSAAAWQTLVERAAAGRVYGSRRIEIRARTNLASELIELSEIDRARIEIDRVLALDPNASNAIALRRKLLTK
jgi:tetratricopeptide (TPR) repeat protein